MQQKAATVITNGSFVACEKWAVSSIVSREVTGNFLSLASKMKSRVWGKQKGARQMQDSQRMSVYEKERKPVKTIFMNVKNKDALRDM